MQAVQAIEKSNEHVEKAVEAMKEKPEFDTEYKAHVEAQLANAKALQALAFAILATIEAGEKEDIKG